MATQTVAMAATAASMALPPCWKMRFAASTASGCGVATADRLLSIILFAIGWVPMLQRCYTMTYLTFTSRFTGFSLFSRPAFGARFATPRRAPHAGRLNEDMRGFRRFLVL